MKTDTHREAQILGEQLSNFLREDDESHVYSKALRLNHLELCSSIILEIIKGGYKYQDGTWAPWTNEANDGNS